MDEKWSLIALHQIQGVGWHTIDRLHQFGWQPGSPITSSELDFLDTQRIPKKIIKEIKKTYSAEYVKQVKSRLESSSYQAITILDDDYPESLRELAQSPWVLYVLGDRNLLDTHSLSIVGTRKPTTYGKNVTRLFATQLARSGWTIVSGMALGIDGLAHQATLEVNGKTIAVLGSGIDVVYPKSHRSLYEKIAQNGLVISEMPPGTRAHPGLFPQRNRIVSGLSHGILVIEAAEKSGSLITTDFALEQGKDVFAVPGSIYSEQSKGTLHLIQQGAKCVIQPEDILEEYDHLMEREDVAANSETMMLTDREQEIWDILSDEAIQITELMQRLKHIPVGELHRTLLQMEMKKYIEQLPGSRYIRLEIV